MCCNNLSFVYHPGRNLHSCDDCRIPKPLVAPLDTGVESIKVSLQYTVQLKLAESKAMSMPL